MEMMGQLQASAIMHPYLQFLVREFGLVAEFLGREDFVLCVPAFCIETYRINIQKCKFPCCFTGCESWSVFLKEERNVFL
jgi:hypothetical protein